MSDVQSCYLPGTQIQFAWDSTSLGYLKTCPRLYQYVMLEGWTSTQESIHLRFGIEYHKGLEEYDRQLALGTKPAEALEYTVHELLKRTYGWDVDTDTKAGKYKNRDTLVGLVIDYVDFFKDDPAKTVILADGRPAVELSFRFELGWGPQATYLEGQGETTTIESAPAQPYLLCGHLDRVVDFADHLFVMDRKTTYTSIGTHYFQQYNPSNQMTIYTLAGGIVLDSLIKGVIIDGAQILLTEPNRFLRGFTYRTQDQLDEWMEGLSYWLNLAEGYAKAGYWPMNDMSCDKFGGCRFREVCSKSPQVREQFLRSSFVQLAPEERWNPLKSRG